MVWLTPASNALPASLVTKVDAITAARAHPSGEAQAEQGVTKALMLAVRPTGFEPAEVTLPADSYLLVVQNRSGLRGVTLRLDEASRGRVLEMKLKARLDWRKRVNLAPGNYTLTAADNPEWVCRVTITP